MAKFGQTWWGQKWLNSLTHIDYSNRLPRGRSYAGNGSVKSIIINKNRIQAKVKGSRRTPYRVDIVVPEFSEASKNKLTTDVINNPLIVSKLLTRELPLELFNLTEKNKIQLFPNSWKDFHMSCSCPDWAVPCKHIASVIYIIANEIDKNPFLIFNLHGLDILERLESLGFGVKSKNLEIPQTVSFFKSKSDDKNLSSIVQDTKEIDFSIIPDLKENILLLLDEQTIFTSKNFKSVLIKSYSKISKETFKYINTIKEKKDVDFFVEYEKYINPEIIVNKDFSYLHTILYSETDQNTKVFENLIEYLNNIQLKYVDRLAPAIKSLYFIYHFSLKILQNSAYVPQILQFENKEYFIRQIPALMNPVLRKIFDLIVNLTPKNIVKIKDKANKFKYLSNNDQVIFISSLFIDYFVNQFVGKKLPDNTADDEIAKLFFAQQTMKFDKLDQKETAHSIYRWLFKFQMTHREFVPLIKIDEYENNNFSVSLFVENKKESFSEPISLNDFLTKEKYINDKLPVLEVLSYLSDYFTDLNKIIAEAGKGNLVYDSDSFVDVLFKIIPTVKLLGITILLPKSLKEIVLPKKSLALTAKKTTVVGKSYLNLDEILDYNWQIAIGDNNFSVDEFINLVENFSGIVKIKDQYVFINKEDVQKLLNNLQKNKSLKNNELLQAAISQEYETAKIFIDDNVQMIINDLLKFDKVELPEQILASLRPYQQEGYEWLYKNSKIGFGSIIADDMGLGKTLQVIATIQKLKLEGKLIKQKGLVVVPTTLLTNWTKEIEKFAPDLIAKIYHGTNRKLDLEGVDMIITTYGIIRSDEKILSKNKWAFIVIDEAQNIKNPGTAQTKAVKKIKAEIKIAMSGTPVENRLAEYWSIFDFTNPKYLGTLKFFTKEFALPIENYRDQKKLDTFKKITDPFIIRRLKTDKTIISDLPEKIQNDKYVNLTKEQTAIYQNVVDNILAEINNTDDSGIERKGLVFKLMTALKQVCNHPSQFLKKTDFNPILSGKSMVLLDLLEKIYENNEKVLIFTQYKEMGLILEKMIYEKFHTQTLFLYGGLSRKKRDKMIDDFQEKPHLKTFILSIRAAGTGLNLTAANNIIHYDLWWNPAVENQATDRAFRIGQKKNVMVYRLITQGTFEEKINQMITSKKELADLTVATGEKWIGNLSNDELKELVEI